MLTEKHDHSEKKEIISYIVDDLWIKYDENKNDSLDLEDGKLFIFDVL